MRASHCTPKIIHQFLDSAAAGQPLAKKGFLKHPGILAKDARRTESILEQLEAFSLSLGFYVVN